MNENQNWNMIANPLLEHLKFLTEEGILGLELSGQTRKSDMVESRNTQEQSSLDSIRELIGNCTRCPLNQNRHNIVFGEGNPNPEIVFVGEGPGKEEDLSGIPFVGRAGNLLDRIIAAMDLSREDVYITNIVKCRPPNNRNPDLIEINTCTPFLKMQLKLLKPKIIVALGKVAATYLTGKTAPMAVLRGKNYQFMGMCVRSTYHPAALLRNPDYRKPVWDDVKEVMAFIGKPIQMKRNS